ncbi:hypothetical protein ASG87_07875 [Frateuria sp. Soil773]|nr:hypothetical protein ASG87_07875 [Frateuria sp. Soil773]
MASAIYWPGLHGGWLFDDYPNIVDNKGVQPTDINLASLLNAALSSPASEFKRPLASLSFAANYLVSGLDPHAMKLTNLIIHLLNGGLVFILARALLDSIATKESLACDSPKLSAESPRAGRLSTARSSPASVTAALIAAGWMLLPINLTGVLYVVQRMESLANLFVLLGLIGYVTGRRRMSLDHETHPDTKPRPRMTFDRGFILCSLSLCISSALGLMAKETAIMLPLYASLIEWILFRFRTPTPTRDLPADHLRRDRRILALFALTLALPMALGLAKILPGLLNPANWATRDFTLGTRLLSEARVVVDYIQWTLLPTPQALSFYHDDFQASSGLLTPWTTLASMAVLACLLISAFWLRRRQPLAALGIALFLGSHLLTGTILPLELVYEHRNYFASLGLLLAIVPPLLALNPGPRTATFALPRRTLLACLLAWWTVNTAITAHAWGDPLSLAEELAERAPESPRAQYELGRTYIIYSHYDPDSPFTRLAYAPLERAAALPKSSILPQQALIFMNSRMHLPLKEAWWDSMIAKLRARRSGVQDESSLQTLTQCAREGECKLPADRMTAAFQAALSFPNPSARLLATYGDYAWNLLDDRKLGLRMTEAAIASAPGEPAYRITQVRMLAALGRANAARAAYRQLETLNIGGRLDASILDLRQQVDEVKAPAAPSS